MPFKCTKQRDDIVDCIKGWLDNTQFRDEMIREYLNERSHYRETGETSRKERLTIITGIVLDTLSLLPGIPTVRYIRGAWVDRDPKDPPLDENGKYRPRKPKQFDEAYANRDLPEWAKGQYEKS